MLPDDTSPRRLTDTSLLIPLGLALENLRRLPVRGDRPTRPPMRTKKGARNHRRGRPELSNRLSSGSNGHVEQIERVAEVGHPDVVVEDVDFAIVVAVGGVDLPVNRRARP